MAKGIKAGFLHVGLGVLAFMCTGADGCGTTDYDKVSDLKITYNGKEWTRTVTNRKTHGFTQALLSPVSAVGGPSVDGAISDGRITGLSPREFFLFNEFTTSPFSGKFYSNLKFAAANPGFAAKPAFQTNMARFIDHGACRSNMAWTSTDGTGSGLLEIIRDAVGAEFRKQIVEGGASEAWTTGSALQVSFGPVGPYGWVAGGDVADGFSMAMAFEGETVWYASNVKVSLGVNYAFILDRGFIGLRSVDWPSAAVSHPRSDAEGNMLKADIMDQLAYRLPAVLRARALYGDGGKLTSKATSVSVVCSPDSSVDVCGTSPEARNTLADRIASIGKIPKGEALKLANDLPAAGFECRPRVDGVDDQEADTAYNRCYWHPTFKRINITPIQLELVWSDPELAETPDLRAARLLGSGGGVDCTLSRQTLNGPVAGITEGDWPTFSGN